MLFEIINSQIVPFAETLAIKEFKEIWDRDSSENKDMAFRELSYIFHSCDLRSAYRSFPENGRDSTIIIDIFGKDKWEPDKKVEGAKKRYNQLNKGRLSLLLEDAYSAVDMLREYFTSINLVEKDKFGKLVYSAKDFMSNIKMLSDAIKSIKSLEKEVDKENVEGNRIRGGGEKHMDEDP